MKNILYIIIILVIIGGGYFLFSKKTEAPNAIQSEQTTTTAVPTATREPAENVPEQTSGISKEEVSKHADATSCYTIISDKVYDLTSWINKHPGGKQAILSICGKDGTVAFDDQHGEENKPQNILTDYFIGNLAR